MKWKLRPLCRQPFLNTVRHSAGQRALFQSKGGLRPRYPAVLELRLWIYEAIIQTGTPTTLQPGRDERISILSRFEGFARCSRRRSVGTKRRLRAFTLVSGNERHAGIDPAATTRAYASLIPGDWIPLSLIFLVLSLGFLIFTVGNVSPENYPRG